ncbi:hypothetical protein COLU111180_19965 [Cohnella lubricantis]|nr:hypothetical protein [Cohnella lubricantis]
MPDAAWFVRSFLLSRAGRQHTLYGAKGISA